MLEGRSCVARHSLVERPGQSLRMCDRDYFSSDQRLLFKHTQTAIFSISPGSCALGLPTARLTG